jgi:hypothetical protein
MNQLKKHHHLKNVQCKKYIWNHQFLAIVFKKFLWNKNIRLNPIL